MNRTSLWLTGAGLGLLGLSCLCHDVHAVQPPVEDAQPSSLHDIPATCSLKLVGPVTEQPSLLDLLKPTLSFWVNDHELSPVGSGSSGEVLDAEDVASRWARLRPLVLEMLATEGYFSPSVELVAGASECHLHLDPGEPVRISELALRWQGNLSTSPEGLTGLEQAWSLKPGDPFTQRAWASSKQQVLQRLQQRHYPLAKLIQSRAEIDPVLHRARLNAVYDAGPKVRFAPPIFVGLQRYPEHLLLRYQGLFADRLKPGADFDQEAMLAWQTALQSSAYFSAVDMTLLSDLNPDEEARSDNVSSSEGVALPLRVRVQEASTRRIRMGAGISSNTGARTELSYQNLHFTGQALHLQTGLRLEQRRQLLYSDLFLPPRSALQQDSFGASLERTDLNGLVTRRQAVGAIRRFTPKQPGQGEWQIGLHYQNEERDLGIAPTTIVNALVASTGWTLRRVDNVLQPRRGYVWQVTGAVASKSLWSEQDFARLYTRWQRYASWKPNQIWSMRLEWGELWSPSRDGIPQEYLFRSGGTGTVRGLPYLGLGLRDAGGIVGGRRLAVASLEHTVWLQGGQGPWGVGSFVDYGSVVDRGQPFKGVAAVGLGPRYKTPAGSLALDIAKAEGQDRPRVHFSLGIAF